MNDVDFDRWMDEFAADCVRSKPQLATSALYFSGAEQDALDRSLVLANNYGGTYGAQIAQAQAALARRGLEELARFTGRALSGEQRTSAAVLRWNLDKIVASAEFARHRFVFNQFVGLHVALVMFLTNVHPLRNERDAENYVARLALVPELLDEGIAEANAAAAEGIVPPRFILERTIEQLDGLMTGAPADHALVATFARRIEAIRDFSTERRSAFVAVACDEVRNRVLPAFARVRATLVAQIRDSGDAAGAWRLPSGKAFYACELAAATGSSLSAEQIHEIGLREVALVEAEMDEILRELGYADGPLPARVERLNETLQLPADPDPRDVILEQLAAIVTDAQSRSEAVFDVRPKAPVIVKREPAFSERSAAAHYTPPAPDGSQPGIYWAPLADLGVRVPWLGIGLKSTAYHEAVPGHHFQLALQQESTELPRFRKLGAFGYDPSFAEGWALYAEQLCAENDWYAGDLPGRLGYLQMQLFRARRLVVDTGLHEMKWTRQQAIDYGFTAAEIERYVVWPGQACSYMIGRLRILEIRDRAQAALGRNFSIKEFHNLVLGGGTMPLDILASEVDSWARSFGTPDLQGV
jgi:uncharacterized protein (DUF885 family)